MNASSFAFIIPLAHWVFIFPPFTSPSSCTYHKIRMPKKAYSPENFFYISYNLNRPSECTAWKLEKDTTRRGPLLRVCEKKVTFFVCIRHTRTVSCNNLNPIPWAQSAIVICGFNAEEKKLDAILMALVQQELLVSHGLLILLTCNNWIFRVFCLQCLLGFNN